MRIDTELEAMTIQVSINHDQKSGHIDKELAIQSNRWIIFKVAKKK
jgi:hypothetical protein